MPYSVPAPQPAPLPIHSQGRAGHRRSYTTHLYPDPSSSTSGTPSSAFSSLGALPRRRHNSAMSITTQNLPKKPTFHLGRDEDDDEDSSPDDQPTNHSTTSKSTYHDNDRKHNELDDEDRTLPPLRLKVKQLAPFSAASASSPRSSPRSSPPPQIHLQPSSAAANGGPVPFPRTSPLGSPTATPPHLTYPTDAPPQRPSRPSVSRTSSTPILLSNGKPLKSSLKSSSSSPDIPFPPQSLVPSRMYPELHPHHNGHQRAASAPSTPHFTTVSIPSSTNSSATSSEAGSPPHSPLPTPKVVHFPSSEEGGLATIKLFNRTGKPASLSRNVDETETETEGESSASGIGPMGAFGMRGGWGSIGARQSRGYPFPKVPSSPKSPLRETTYEFVTQYTVDATRSDVIPRLGAERGEGNVYIESLGFATERGPDGTFIQKTPLTLLGTLLVRNLSYQKAVAVRYTLDDWHTTNEVLAQHVKSLDALPIALSHLGRGQGARRIRGPDDIEAEEATGSGKTWGDLHPAWDRFAFDISLEGYASTLERRTMFMVGKYATNAVGGTGYANLVRAGVNAGAAGEWWDNNNGSNYRIGFAKIGKEVKVEKEVSKEAEVPAEGYKRSTVVSAPSVYMPKPVPAPPQISNSVSFPSTSYHAPQPQSIYNPQEAQQRQAALTQSTLARLKKLNLRNYAAPHLSNGRLVTSSISSVASADSVSTSASQSTVTSADSTPLQTPVMEEYKEAKGIQLATHDPDTNLLGGNGSLLSRRSDSPAVQSLTMHLENGYPATYLDDGRKVDANLAGQPELGSSPPFSDMSGIHMAGATRSNKVSEHEDNGSSWSWSSFSAAGPRAPKEDDTVEPYHSRSRSASGSGIAIGMGAIAPPQRRRASGASAHIPTHHNGHANGHHKAATKTSEDSSSGSGSDSRRRSANATPTPTRPMSPVAAPSSRRVWAPLSSFVGGAHVTSPMGRTGSPMGSPVPSPPPSSEVSTPTGMAAPTSPKDDAVYQAFVRQWCFAQGPSPSTGPSGGINASDVTPEKRLAVS
ncbi:hypothetical protein CVT24_000923 [Panaeolus cyanescens]|uniref:CBM21 domain-containing protein n=1 Tax=Panaeolus cyanescens TaxID=181874 RepID=A0A409YTB4_9AGAR|nr:hypothetical protein CVT24_000923 [Panaeolus cyanescens]